MAQKVELSFIIVDPEGGPLSATTINQNGLLPKLRSSPEGEPLSATNHVVDLAQGNGLKGGA